MSGENKGLQRRFRHHMPYQIYINCRNHKLALCVKHLMQSFPVLQNVDTLLITVWKLFHYSPQKCAIFKEIQSTYGMKNLMIIRAAATRWLSHGHACRRLVARFVQVVDTLDAILDRKYEPEIEGLRNMLCSKTNVTGVVVLCDILEPLIVFSDYLQGDTIVFSKVNQKLKELTDELHSLCERFRSSLLTNDVNLYFSKLPGLFQEIDDRTDLRRRLRNCETHNMESIVAEVAVPITHHLIHELEDAFHCPPVLSAFEAFSMELLPDNPQEHNDYMKPEIQALARHYGTPKEDIFQGHRTDMNPTYTEALIQTEFEQFKRQMLIIKNRDPRPDLYEELQSDRVVQNAFPIMYYLIGLGRIIPSSTASVERIFSLMNSLCTPARSSLGQCTLQALMRICEHHNKSTAVTLSDIELAHIVDRFKQMRAREMCL